MKNLLIVTLVAVVFVLAGCASNKPGAKKMVQAESARVFIEGRDRGVTPMTLRVIRSRGEYDVRLVQGQKVVRVFELAHGGAQRSPERHAIEMDLGNDNSAMGFRTLEVDDLESVDDTLYIIPYLPETVAIDDKKYGLTLLVSN